MGNFACEYSVRSAEMDASYRLKPASALMYFQECFATYCTNYNLAAFQISERNLIWVISDVNIEFIGDIPCWRESVKVEINVLESKKLRLFVRFKMYLDGQMIARGDSCFYILDKLTRRPKPLEELASPLVMADYVGDFEANLFSSDYKNCSKIDLLPRGEFLVSTNHIANVLDLDFNLHVNNLSYINLAYSTLPLEYLKCNQIKALSVKFLKECFLNDNLKALLYKDENTFYNKLIRLNENVVQKNEEEVCLIKFTF